jgi:hypothetical protein
MRLPSWLARRGASAAKEEPEPVLKWSLELLAGEWRLFTPLVYEHQALVKLHAQAHPALLGDVQEIHLSPSPSRELVFSHRGHAAVRLQIGDAVPGSVQQGLALDPVGPLACEGGAAVRWCAGGHEPAAVVAAAAAAGMDATSGGLAPLRLEYESPHGKVIDERRVINNGSLLEQTLTLLPGEQPAAGGAAARRLPAMQKRYFRRASTDTAATVMTAPLLPFGQLGWALLVCSAAAFLLLLPSHLATPSLIAVFSSAVVAVLFTAHKRSAATAAALATPQPSPRASGSASAAAAVTTTMPPTTTATPRTARAALASARAPGSAASASASAAQTNKSSSSSSAPLASAVVMASQSRSAGKREGFITRVMSGKLPHLPSRTQNPPAARLVVQDVSVAVTQVRKRKTGMMPHSEFELTVETLPLRAAAAPVDGIAVQPAEQPQQQQVPVAQEVQHGAGTPPRSPSAPQLGSGHLSRSWGVWRRYSAIMEFHARLEHLLETHESRKSLFTREVPAIPRKPRTYRLRALGLTDRDYEDLMQRRMAGLREFFTRLFGPGSDADKRLKILADPHVQRFLGINSHSVAY